MNTNTSCAFDIVIRVSSRQFIVYRDDRGDPVHRVCMMSDDGRRIVHSHGGQPGSDTGQYHVTVHLAVDDNPVPDITVHSPSAGVANY